MYARLVPLRDLLLFHSLEPVCCSTGSSQHELWSPKRTVFMVALAYLPSCAKFASPFFGILFWDAAGVDVTVLVSDLSGAFIVDKVGPLNDRLKQ